LRASFSSNISACAGEQQFIARDCTRRFGRRHDGENPLVRIVLVVLATLILAPAAGASITVATNAASPKLRVDARGNAEVSWTSGGVRRYLLVPPRGRVYPGRRLAAADVSRPVSSPALPFRRALRLTPDGRYWALQAWRPQPGGPVELRFSRWKGAPTNVRLVVETSTDAVRLSGTATLAGTPLPLWSPTPEGKRIRQYVYLDSLRGGTWRRIGGVALRSDGSYRRLVPIGLVGGRYRALIPGPNIGATYAPDAATVAAAP
jgi:hypothetical protein